MAATRLTGASRSSNKLIGDTGYDLRTIAPAQHIFVGDDHPAGLLHRSGNRLPIVGTEGTQVELIRPPGLVRARLLGRAQGPGHDGPIGNHGQVLTWRTMLALPKGMANSGPGYAARPKVSR